MPRDVPQQQMPINNRCQCICGVITSFVQSCEFMAVGKELRRIPFMLEHRGSNRGGRPQKKKRRQLRHLWQLGHLRVPKRSKQGSWLLVAKSPRSFRPRLRTTRVRLSFRRSALLRDICAELHSRFRTHFPADFFLLEEEAATRPCGHPAVPTNLQVEWVLRSWSSTKTYQEHIDARDQGSKEKTCRCRVFFTE